MNNPKSKITIRNSADVCRIEIEGIIGVPEEWQFDQPSSRVATYEKFRDTVKRIAAVEAPEVVVDIRSTGGDVNDALLICDALKSLGGRSRITTRCFGYTASAATVIAQAASEGCRQLSANALYLIHQSSCSVEGNAAELDARADLLRKTDERLAALYASRSGREAAEFAALMAENGGEGRWLSPAEAVAAGLADVIAGESTAEPSEEPEQSGENRITDFIARNKARLLSVLGLDRPQIPDAAADINVLRFDGGANLHAASAIAFHEGQRRVCASDTLPTEDPSTNEIRRSANERAYERDARSFASRN